MARRRLLPAVGRRLGRLTRHPPEPAAPAPAERPAVTSPADAATIERSLAYTMTSPERLQACIDAVRYCHARDLPGAFAECGVWRGGSVLAMILTLQELGAERDIYLYDTFTGMTEPTEHDTSAHGPSAVQAWTAAATQGERAWPEVFGPGKFGQDQVRSTLTATGYPESRLHLIAGPVEETLEGALPSSLALLRLDTDWYESTRLELELMYPLLAVGGALIVDDYGHWDGARKAVDEYFAQRPPMPLLHRIDYTGRMAIKL